MRPRSALHPAALALLIAGAVGGALVAWPLAAAGAVAYAGAVAVVNRRARAPDGTSLLPAPKPPVSGIRSTAVMAQVVRIRKAHHALHAAIDTATPSVRRLLDGTYRRACELVDYAYQQARVADDLRTRLDLPRSQAGALVGTAREPVEAAVATADTELSRVATALEQWHHKVVHARAETSAGDADQAAQDVAHELERMLEAAKQLEALTRGL